MSKARSWRNQIVSRHGNPLGDRMVMRVLAGIFICISTARRNNQSEKSESCVSFLFSNIYVARSGTSTNPYRRAIGKKGYAGITRRASQHAFEQLQIVEQVSGYLLKPGVNEKLVATYDDVKGFLKEFEALYRKQYPKTPALDLDRIWTTFMRDLTTKMKVWTKGWLLYRANEMAKDWATAAILSYAQEALTILEKAQEHQKKHGIAVDKFKPDVVFK